MQEKPTRIEKNPIPARYMKFIGAGVAGLIELANIWASGPEWLHAAATVAGAVWVVLVPNAPKYRPINQ